MRMDDIRGAQPTVGPANKVRNNAPSFHDNGDILGSKSTVLHPTLNKVSHVCSNEDIEGTVLCGRGVALDWSRMLILAGGIVWLCV
jgi:hypothetical protein